jgi:hypothetical protein
VRGEDEEEDDVGRRVPSSLSAGPRETMCVFALN